MSREWPRRWQGSWIWAAVPPFDPSPLALVAPPPPATWNRFALLRRAFHLTTRPRSAPARVTADSRFVLCVNGVEVARGPARGPAERIAWVDVDLAPHLREGRNVLAATVRFYGRPVPWWQPARPSGQLGFGGFAFEAPEVGVVSDSTWRCHPGGYDPATAARLVWPPMAPVEVCDARVHPAGFTEPDFDDSAWPAATVLVGSNFMGPAPGRPGGSTNYTRPQPEQLPPRTALPVAARLLATVPVPMAEAPDPVTALLGAGPDSPVRDQQVFGVDGTTLATPWVEATGPAGSMVDVWAGEVLGPDGAVQLKPRYYGMRLILRGEGTERLEGFDAVGLRYLGVTSHGGASLTGVGATERRHPRADGARFHSDDPALDAVWAAGLRTLDLCSTDAFIDCPGREQRAWVGDAYLHVLLSQVTDPDPRLRRRHLRLAAAGQRADGLLPMVGAGDAAMLSMTIPDYSLHWVRALAREVAASGDLAFARALLPVAGAVLDAFASWQGGDGLLADVPGWLFLDWAMLERGPVHGAVSFLYALACQDHAELLDRTGADPERARTSRARAAAVVTGAELLWDEARGVYVDAAGPAGPGRRVSQHTNALAVLAGLPAGRAGRILDAVLDRDRLAVTPLGDSADIITMDMSADPAQLMDFDPERSVVAAQPFFRHFVHQAVAAAGRAPLLVGLCRDWVGLTDGSDTVPELWQTLRDSSRAHAWSATPTFDLSRHVVGLQPVPYAPSQWWCRPALGGLARASSTVPAGGGWLRADVTATEITLEVPEGLQVRVEGDPAPLGPGRHTVGRDVPPG